MKATSSKNRTVAADNLSTPMHFLNMTRHSEVPQDNKQKKLLKDASKRNIKDIFNSHFINNGGILFK
jgi:hypothetical protein